MQFRGIFHKPLKFITGSLIAVHSLAAQSAGSIEGTITLAATGDALHSANILMVELGRRVTSDPVMQGGIFSGLVRKEACDAVL